MDEKYGEDELTFFLYCLRVLDAEAWRPGNGGIDWGENYWMNPSASLIKDAPMENNGDGEMDGGDGKYANQKRMEATVVSISIPPFFLQTHFIVIATYFLLYKNTQICHFFNGINLF